MVFHFKAVHILKQNTKYNLFVYQCFIHIFASINNYNTTLNNKINTTSINNINTATKINIGTNTVTKWRPREKN
jgi:hypothetical protein